MDPIFWEQATLRISAHEMVLELEAFEVPKAYDGGGEPVHYRIVLKGPETMAACDNLRELACAAPAAKFPIAEFIGQYPGQMASMIATLEGLRRPVQDDDFFEFVETPYNVRLSEIKPRLVDDELHWFAVPVSGDEAMQEIRLSARTLALVGGRQIQPVDPAWAPILRGWDVQPCLPPPAASRQDGDHDS